MATVYDSVLSADVVAAAVVLLKRAASLNIADIVADSRGFVAMLARSSSTTIADSSRIAAS
jgi:hypothetical protein